MLYIMIKLPNFIYKGYKSTIAQNFENMRKTLTTCRATKKQFALLLFLTMQLIAFNMFGQGPQPTLYAFPTAFNPIPLGEGLPDCMKTNSLPISTGNKWKTGSLYAFNEVDQYWHIIANGDPNIGSQIMCPFMNNTGCGAIYTGTKPISIINGGSCADDADYVFRRSFWVDAPVGPPITCSLNLNMVQDDKIKSVTVGNTVFTNNLGISTGNLSSCTQATWTIACAVTGGLNYIDVTVRNIDLGGGGSNMYLDVLGSINYAGSDLLFVDNNHYVPNTSSEMGAYQCSSNNQYAVVPAFSGTCLASGVSGTITITNYNPGFVYHLYPANTIISGSFTGIGGNTYTVTVDDKQGCILSKTVLIGNPSVTANVMGNCIPVGGTTSIGAIGTGNSPYTYSLNGGTFGPGFIFTGNGAGTYTITVKDAYGCTGTSTAKIVNTFSASLTASSICINGSQTTTLTAANTSQNPPVTYVFQAGGVPIGANQYLVSSPGIYTVTATDGMGCTATSTIQIFQNNIPAITVAPANIVPYCSATPVQLEATPNNPALYTYGWTGNPTAPLSPSGNPVGVNNNATSTYTVVVTDASGCTRTATYKHLANPFCCSDYFFQPATHLISTSPIYNNGTANGIITHFGMGNVISTTDHVLIDGDVNIDADITFFNCPNLHFMPNAKLIMTDGHTLTINRSRLDAACEIWGGILATNNTQTVNIQDSWIEDMSIGVRITGTPAYSAALLNCKGTTFWHNIHCIGFSNTPTAYAGYVTNNNFYDNPTPNPNITEDCISIFNCKTLNIGSATGGGNYMHSVKSGVFIMGWGAVTMNINLVNNTFEDIHGGGQVNVSGNNIYGTNEGCGVFATSVFNANINLNMNHFNTTATHFKDMDKGVITTGVNTTINNATAVNVKACFMNTGTSGKRYFMNKNTITNSYIGMNFTGNDLSGSVINQNTIHMPTVQYYNFPAATPFRALGIVLQRQTQNPASFAIKDNTIHLNYKAYQRGISIHNGGFGVSVETNSIDMPVWLPVNTATMMSQSQGIVAYTDNNSLIKSNVIRMGGAWGIGIDIGNTSNMRIFCNDVEAAYGMRVQGNNLTVPTNIGNNRFAGNTAGGFGYMCMNYVPVAAQDGWVGEIGSAAWDMNNKFYGMVPTTEVYRTTMPGCNNFGYKIYTVPTNLIQTESTGSNPSCYYEVFVPNVGYSTYTCSPPLNMPNNVMIANIPFAEEVARNLAVFTGFQTVTSQIEQQNLYEALAKDSTTRVSSTILDSFYNANLTTTLQDIYNVNHLVDQWMADSTNMTDSAQFAINLSAARAANALITSSLATELNEKAMNEIYFDVLEKGIDSLTTAQKAAIEALADDCPFVSGRGVYKARGLYDMYHPGVDYDDRYTCNGSYKNGDAYSEDERIREEMDRKIEAMLSAGQNKVTLYPNPANENLTIKYMIGKESKASLEIVDMIGNVQMSLDLKSEVQIVTANVGQLPTGAYIYRFIVDGRQMQTGKLLINK